MFIQAALRDRAQPRVLSKPHITAMGKRSLLTVYSSMSHSAMPQSFSRSTASTKRRSESASPTAWLDVCVFGAGNRQGRVRIYVCACVCWCESETGGSNALTSIYSIPTPYLVDQLPREEEAAGGEMSAGVGGSEGGVGLEGLLLLWIEKECGQEEEK